MYSLTSFAVDQEGACVTELGTVLPSPWRGPAQQKACGGNIANPSFDEEKRLRLSMSA